MNKTVRFLLEGLLREKIGGGAEIHFTSIGKDLEIRIEGVEIEFSRLKGYLRDIFRCFRIKDLDLGFFAYNEDLSEILAVSVRASRDLVNYNLPPFSQVSIQNMR
ncbi:MAG: hypothetical protein ABIF17_01710 [Patescibacteria group bacterium]